MQKYILLKICVGEKAKSGIDAAKIGRDIVLGSSLS